MEQTESGFREDGPGGQVAYFYKRKQVALLLALCLGVIFFSTLQIALRADKWIMFLALLVVLTIAALWLLKATISTKPVLVIGPMGIVIPQMSGDSTIPWSEVREVHEKYGLWTPLLWFDIATIERFEPPPWSPLRRILSALDGPPNAVRAFCLTASPADIRATIERYRAQASEEGSSSRR